MAENYCNEGAQLATMGNIPPVPYAESEKMSLKNHKRLTELAYRVKDFIDANGGLTYQEACQFGNLMTSIIHLK